MSLSFTKLFSSITESTIWDAAHHVRIVWITLLAMADRHGIVLASIPGLAHRARVTLPEVEEALAVFAAPDAYSRTRDHEGRRVTEIDGGWLLLNYEKYRELQDSERVKEAKRRWAAKRRAVTVTEVDSNSLRESKVDIAPSASASVFCLDQDRSLEEPEQIEISPGSGVVQAATPGVKRGTVDNLDGWEPKPELYARALELGLPREIVDERIAELRTGPVGGVRGVFPNKRDAYVMGQLGKWRTWHETARAAAVHRPGSPSGGAMGVRRGQSFRAILEPTSKHREYAKKHGLDLPTMVRDLELTDILEQLGHKRALEILAQRMSEAVRKRASPGAP